MRVAISVSEEQQQDTSAAAAAEPPLRRRSQRRNHQRSSSSSSSFYPNNYHNELLLSLQEAEDDDHDENGSRNSTGSYELWDPLSLKSFTMDLYNLALDDPVRAEDAVQIMRELYWQQNNPDHSSSSSAAVLPDAACYTTVLDGYIQAGQLDEAQRILDGMLEESAQMQMANSTTTATSSDASSSSSSVAPSDLTFLLMAQAWANDYHDDFSGRSAEKAVQVLRQMQAVAASSRQQQQQQRRRSVVVPETSTTLTTNLSAENDSATSDLPETTEDRAAPTSSIVKVWSIVVEGWCKRAGIARHAMKEAEQLLDEMEREEEQEEENGLFGVVRPNVLTYTSYIGGLSRSQQHDMARKAEAVLDRMERFGVQPDMVAYTAVLNCYAKAVSRRERSMAGARALSILAEMERLYISQRVYSAKPSLITYGTAIAAIGNCLDRNAPDMAEGVLKRMYKLSAEGTIANLKPVTTTYNAVLYALSRAPVQNRRRTAQRAEQILEEMERRAAVGGEKDVQPDVRTWATLLRAWARCRQEDAAVQAQRVLDKMEYKYKKGTSLVRPNYVCFTTVRSTQDVFVAVYGQQSDSNGELTQQW